MNFLRKLLILIILASTLTVTVQAYESDINVWIMDADYPETAEAGGVLNLEVTVGYNFTQAATLNVWVSDGPWYSYDSEIVADVYVDVSEPGPKVVSVEVPVPDEAGEYIYNAEVGWCELDSTELLPKLGGYQEYNITFTATSSETTDTGNSESSTGEDTTNNTQDETGGIPGFPVYSIISGTLIALIIRLVPSRWNKIPENAR